jgi:hypothetical protein
LNCSNPLFKRSTASITYKTNNQKTIGHFAIPERPTCILMIVMQHDGGRERKRRGMRG